MKQATITIAAIPLLLCSCSYASKKQAEVACWEWAEKGGTYTQVRKDPNDTVWEYTFYLALEVAEDKKKEWDKYPITPKQVKFPRRYCDIEHETNQFLGYEKNAKRSQVVMQYDEDKIGSEVKANFRF